MDDATRDQYMNWGVVNGERVGSGSEIEVGIEIEIGSKVGLELGSRREGGQGGKGRSVGD